MELLEILTRENISVDVTFTYSLGKNISSILLV